MNHSTRHGLSVPRFLCSLWLAGLLLIPAIAHAEPVALEIPAQSAGDALLVFIKQSGVQVTYVHDEIKDARTNALSGSFEPARGLQFLLKDTGLGFKQRSPTWFVITKSGAAKPALIEGTVREEKTGRPVGGANVSLRGTNLSTQTDRSGRFALDEVPPGNHTLGISADGMQTTRVTDVTVRSGVVLTLGAITLPVRVPGVLQLDDYVVSAKKNDGMVELDPYEVSAQRNKPFTTPNMDIPRTVDDVQPYYIFDSKSIGRSGAADPEDFLRKNLTMDATSYALQQSTFQAGQSSSINLRGLGDSQTLILINGRRSSGNRTSFSGANQTDLNNIPLASIDRIEVLPTSASAIYGANAIGGVVNVVLKRNYSGGEVRTSYQNTFDTDAPKRKVDLTYGLTLGGGRTQIMLTGSWSDDTPLLYQDRPFLREYDLRYLNNTGGETGSVTLLGATPNIRSTPTSATLTLKPAFGGGSLGSNVTFISAGIAPSSSPAVVGAGLLANAGHQNLKPPDSLQIGGGLRATMGTPFDTRSFFGSVRHELTSYLELNAEFAYSGTRTERRMTSSSTSQSVASTVPTNPFNQNVTLFMDIDGEFRNTSNNQNRRSTFGFLMKLPADWTLQGDYTWSTGVNFYSGTGPLTLAGAEVTAALNAGTLNPFVDTTLYSYDISRFLGSDAYSGAGTLNDVTLRLAGPVWRWRAGPILAAAGLERRQDGIGDATSFTTYANFPTRNTASLSLGKRQVTRSAYVEFQVPIVGPNNRLPFLRLLDLQLAGRTEDFNVNTGTSSLTLLPVPAVAPTILSNKARYKSTQPTVGLRLSPVEGVTLRASYSGGFLAPSYSQLQLNPIPSSTTTAVTDPRRGNQLISVPSLTGGNPDLIPETSRSWNAGVIFQPRQVKGLRLSVDWYKIEKDDNIGTVTAQQQVDLESSFPDRVIRGPVPTGDTYGVGPITLLNRMNMNLLKSLHEGLDVSAGYRMDARSFGVFDLSILASYAEHAKTQAAVNTPFTDRVNFTGSGPLKLRHTSNLTWEHRQWTLGWTTYYFNRFKVAGPPLTTSTLSITSQGGPTVPHQIYHDLFATYRFGPKQRSETRSRITAGIHQMLSGLEVQLNIKNVFDTIPPYDVSSQGASYRYSTWGDLRLREYRITLRKPF